MIDQKIPIHHMSRIHQSLNPKKIERLSTKEIKKYRAEFLIRLETESYQAYGVPEALEVEIDEKVAIRMPVFSSVLARIAQPSRVQSLSHASSGSSGISMPQTFEAANNIFDENELVELEFEADEEEKLTSRLNNWLHKSRYISLNLVDHVQQLKDTKLIRLFIDNDEVEDEEPEIELVSPEPPVETPKEAPTSKKAKTEAQKVASKDINKEASKEVEPDSQPVLAQVSNVLSNLIGEIGSSLKNIGPSSRKWRRNYGMMELILIVAVAAQVILYFNQLVGVYAVVASIMILTAIAISSEKLRKVAISVTVLPVVTLLTLCLPQEDFFTQTVIFYCALLLLTLTYRYLFTLDIPKSKTSLNRAWRYLLLIPAMLVAGQFFGIWQYFTLHSYFPFESTPIELVTLSFIIFAIVEEMYYRGLVQASALSETSLNQSIVIGTILFGFGFLNHATPWALVVGLVFGLFLSFVYAHRQNLLLTMAANITSKLLFLGLLVTFR